MIRTVDTWDEVRVRTRVRTQNLEEEVMNELGAWGAENVDNVALRGLFSDIRPGGPPHPQPAPEQHRSSPGAP